MKVLFDIVHPAHVLFFKRPIEILHSQNVDTLILSRIKDITCALLDEFAFTHQPVSTAGNGIFGLAKELVARDIAVIRAAAGFKPDVMIGFGGVAISHAGKILGIPSISFYDSENATLQNRITWPFIDSLYVPESYAGRTPVGRTTRVPGIKALSYLHPSAFQPNREIAIQNGLELNSDNFFVRVVAWRANHDLGKSGWNDETLNALLSALTAHGKIHLSSEVPLPKEFDCFVYKGSIAEVHHLIAHCRLLVGESASMASEAAILGIPAIYCGRDFPGYIRELDGTGLLYYLPTNDTASLLSLLERALRPPLSQARALRDRYVAARPDWALAVVDAIHHSAGKRT